MNEMITVFTPTYNRAYLLERLYLSLIKQTNHSFIWLVVDDGSTDNTKELVERFINENKIRIEYYYQNNKGKMQAHNVGVEKCRTELFLCVDSDDYLIDRAVDILIKQWEENDHTNIAGIIAKKGYDMEKELGKGYFPDQKVCNLQNMMNKTYFGDTTMCFSSKVIKQYLFPVIKDEKFLSETYIYDQIDQKYNYILYPEIITICEYLTDGYSKNMDLISYRNPVGRMYHEAQNMKLKKGVSNKLKAGVRYNMYKKIAGEKDIRKFKLSERFILMITFPIGIIEAYKKKRRINSYD